MIPLSAEILSFIYQVLESAEIQIYQLAGDASARKYYRLIKGDKTFVLMSWEPFNAETYPFLNVLAQFSYAKVNVPHVMGINSQLGVILLDDLGDLTLERKYWESTSAENSWPFYQKALDEIIKIHTTATKESDPNIKYNIAKTTEFDVAKFMWEMNYAKTHLLEGLLKQKLSEKISQDLENVFFHLCTELYKQPQVICHRDYHSRNLMIKLDKVYVIDFQDARRGPIQYDLVSLLKDSYVDISDDYAKQMLSYYLEQTDFVNSDQTSLEKFNIIYELQSVQRCFKACGSFASFMNAREDKRYLKYLPQTLKKVLRSLSYFPEYKLLSDLLIDAGALEKNYAQM
jgi:N-acetylmuramate 1-kinase